MMRRRYRKAKTFERFLELLLWEGCKTVYVSDEVRHDWPFGMPEVGLSGKVGNFTHSFLFTGLPRSDGKGVLFKQDCQTYFGSSRGPSSIEMRALAAIETLAEAEKKVKVFEHPFFSRVEVVFSASDEAIADIERYLRIYGHKADLRVVALYHYLSRKYQYTL